MGSDAINAHIPFWCPIPPFTDCDIGPFAGRAKSRPAENPVCCVMESVSSNEEDVCSAAAACSDAPDEQQLKAG